MLRARITLEVEEKWTRKLTSQEIQDLLNYTETPLYLAVNKTLLDTMIDSISEDTGIRATNYILRIKPTIHTTAENFAGTIDEIINPELSLTFIVGGDFGNVVEISDLIITETGTKTSEIQIPIEGVDEQKQQAGMALVLTAMFFMASIYY